MPKGEARRLPLDTSKATRRVMIHRLDDLLVDLGEDPLVDPERMNADDLAKLVRVIERLK